MQLKKLPIGIQTFSRMIENNYLYIDKTKDALDLMESGTVFYFLSRPRRFGKSLFLDTLQEVFEGNKKLFEGLYIYDKWNFETTYPVIKISFSGDLRSGDSLKEVIFALLKSNQKRLAVECENSSNFGECFKTLIENTHNKYNQKVVILIDEYDKAILDNIDQMEVATENREILKSLYTILKDSEKYIQLCLLTGVSKFSKASIFSGLNMLKDISLTPKYGDICGYTQDDIETTLLPYLEGVDLEKLKDWYNGYNFLKSDVYNPYDILLFIDNNFSYENYWFATGTPTFLIKLIEKNNYFMPNIANLTIGKELLDSFDIDNINLEVILYQAGYLTIDKQVTTRRGSIAYKLKLPNKEVQMSLSDVVLEHLLKTRDRTAQHQDMSYDALWDANLENLHVALKSLFAHIPYNNHTKNNISIYEGYYASVIYTHLQSLGIDIIGEDVTNHGRIDLTVKMNNIIYIIEFKVGSGDALGQIKDKNYAEKYISLNQDIYLVGINFSEEERNICGFEWEKL